MACSVFISYKRGDDEADKIYARLKRGGFSPWMDRKNPRIGVWRPEIEKAIREANIVLVCLSRNSGKPGPFHREIRLALRRNEEMPADAGFIVPVRIEDCKIPSNLEQFQTFDVFREDGWSQLLRALRARCPHARRTPAPVRVLVVDDDPVWRRQIVREKAEDAIRAAGREPQCEEADEFEDALKRLSEPGRWDLLITDIGLPNTNHDLLGMNLAVRAHELHIKCIVVTSDLRLTKEHTWKLGGMDTGYFDKGDFANRSEEFMRKVREVCT